MKCLRWYRSSSRMQMLLDHVVKGGVRPGVRQPGGVRRVRIYAEALDLLEGRGVLLRRVTRTLKGPEQSVEVSVGTSCPRPPPTGASPCRLSR